ncbi:MAG: hypothetical protein ACXWTR_02380 [Methylotenera sp.]
MECIAPIKDSKDAIVLYTVATLIPEAQFQNWVASTQLAAKLLDFDEPERKVVIDQINQREIEQRKPEAGVGKQEASPTPGLAGFIKETFTFPPLNKERMHCEPCMREDSEQLIHVAVGMISPLTKLKWLGSGFITEGKFIGEGKDAIVHAVKGNPEWVIKELKFGSAERAEMLVFYTNQLAADIRFKVPAVTDLGDGRLLQKFVRGSPIANIPYALHQLAAQNEAVALARAAKQALRIREGEEFIIHPPYKVGIDPSFSNFLFDSEGKLTGWIDPLYSISR